MTTYAVTSNPTHGALDPITLEIVWNGLRSINDETWITIQKSAFSTNIKERHDHSTAIDHGRLIAQAEWSLPIHLASMLGLMQILELLLLNMRLPNERRGDLNAQIAACRLGVERTISLFARHGHATVSAAFGEILRRTGRRMKAAIAQIPDGTYGFQDVLDDDGLVARDVLFKLEVRKAGKNIVLDFTGSSPQVPGNVNLTLNAVQSTVCYALKALLDPELPNNHAAIDAVDIIAPSGRVPTA